MKTQTMLKKQGGRRKRPWCLVFSLSTIILALLTFIIIFGFVKLSPPQFQVESISISLKDKDVSKWLIAFSFANPNFVHLRYRAINVSVGGRRPWSSTVASIDEQQLMLSQSFNQRTFQNVTVDVTLPSPRPRLILDGSDFDVRIRTEYKLPLRSKSVAIAECSGKGVGFSMGGGEAVMVGGPVPCDVVPQNEES